jgi:hypothetical protein
MTKELLDTIEQMNSTKAEINGPIYESDLVVMEYIVDNHIKIMKKVVEEKKKNDKKSLGQILNDMETIINSEHAEDFFNSHQPKDVQDVDLERRLFNFSSSSSTMLKELVKDLE